MRQLSESYLHRSEVRHPYGQTSRGTFDILETSKDELHKTGRKRWRVCLGGLSCFGKQKCGTRIVPSSRVPDSNLQANQPNGAQVGGMNNPAAALLAPPSSPASFSNSALPSTAQSPNCFMSANSPVGHSSTMYSTGPYAHETQLVSPPVFSTFTTEPSTAPLTPPPELAHLTTPSSPDVPYAQFLSSRRTHYITSSGDSQLAHSPSPVSPATSSRRSPVSRASRDSLSASFPDRDFPPQWDPLVTSSGQLYGFEGNSKKANDSNFINPATFAQYYLDPSSNPQSAGRLSVSKEADAYSYNGNGNLNNRHNKPNKQDVEELEAYRASFGFSADEIVTTSQYEEISDIADDSFTMTPFLLDEDINITGSKTYDSKSERPWKDFPNLQDIKTGLNHMEETHKVPSFDHAAEGHLRSSRQYRQLSIKDASGNRMLNDDNALLSKMGGGSRNGRKHQFGLSSSDAEVEYRRSRSVRHGRRDLAWHD